MRVRSTAAAVAATAPSVVTALCAVVVVVLLIRREFHPTTLPSTGPLVTAQSDWLKYAKTGQRLGPDGAKVTIVEFSDYQCPFCKRMEERLEAARRKYPADLAVVYRHWPIAGLHAQATNAAVASECAARQGRFEQMHRLLFAMQDSLATVDWPVLASRASVSSVEGFTQCFADTDAALKVVNRDLEDGRRLGINSTPVLLIDGMRYRGAIPEVILDSLIDAVLQRARSGH